MFEEIGKLQKEKKDSEQDNEELNQKLKTLQEESKGQQQKIAAQERQGCIELLFHHYL